MAHKNRTDFNKMLCGGPSLREKSGVQARFLLGPAGSGKTFRCLAEIRAALVARASRPLDGNQTHTGKMPVPTAPLILLAPKQATFQLERQLLAGDELSGYSQLRIYSFDRLARFVLEKLSAAPANQLNDEGRVMVLRALLLRHEQALKRFQRSARRPGFAQQLSQLLSELQQHQFTPAKLRDLTDRFAERPELQGKLHDLAVLGEAYALWLTERGLQDSNHLLDFAIAALRKTNAMVSGQSTAVSFQKRDNPPSAASIQHLWLDGFAEMTPQELDLLAMILPHCSRATLAFCLETEPTADSQQSWLSVWSAVSKTYQQCRQRVENLPDCKIEIEILPRDPKKNRFANNRALSHLENCWQRRVGVSPAPGTPLYESRHDGTGSANVGGPDICPASIACSNPEAEAALAAREILKFVHRDGNRFRDCAILVRNLENYHKPLARAFRHCGIPFFLDRREAVAHHPLAELTRSAVRTIAFGWQHDDWFAALKAGFSTQHQEHEPLPRAKPGSAGEPPTFQTEIDTLENAALEFGWHGKRWLEPLPDTTLERLRQQILPPFETFATQLARHKHQPSGPQLAQALRNLWDELNAEKTLERWGASKANQLAIHSTVWEQMNAWLENIALAFANDGLPLRDWLPILEAGLANLTVGVVPPSLDQVLIGAVDRARNPDLKLAMVLGANEGIFPATPAAPPILTRADRDELEQRNVLLGPNLRDQLARERYLGYIACTRASEKLFVTFARYDANGKSLNPSSLVTHLQTLFPELEIEEFHAEMDWRGAQHVSELVAPLVEICRSGRQSAPSLDQTSQGQLTLTAADNWENLLQLPALAELKKNLEGLHEPKPDENLSRDLAAAVYGPTLQTSVSRLEEFAQCPFRFFVHSGLRAEERKVFELDARERGSFQHEVLKIFHEQLTAAGRRWRDLTPVEARERIGKIAAEFAPDYRDGLLRADDQSRFTARMLSESLQDFVETLVAWMRGQYEFDPAAAELEFGFGPDGAPAWEMDLGGGHRLALRGRIDRIDLCREADSRTWCVVMDYKSGQRKLDKLLVEHGVQLQLLGYLAAMRHWPDPRRLLGAAQLVPAGVFYVNLRGKYDSGATRAEALADREASRRRAYRHVGRFSADALPKLDRRPDAKAGDQFNFRRNRDGSLRKGSAEALPRTEFGALLDRVETQLTEMGRAIFAGAASVDPYRKGNQTPCEYCDYRAVCRIDPWTHQYRLLRAAEATSNNDMILVGGRAAAATPGGAAAPPPPD